MVIESKQPSRKRPVEASQEQKKMSKTDMQFAIAKKKQCDAVALSIVEKLLEPVDSQWLLKNLKHINRSHMEDVIEERFIAKVCGYVLCNNPMKVVIKALYCISTKQNKVFDMRRRKYFCSSRCYCASNHLLEQMLLSPLWLRNAKKIPEFQLLPKEFEPESSVLGEEVIFNEKDEIQKNDGTNNVQEKKVELELPRIVEKHLEMKAESSHVLENCSHKNNKKEIIISKIVVNSPKNESLTIKLSNSENKLTENADEKLTEKQKVEEFKSQSDVKVKKIDFKCKEKNKPTETNSMDAFINMISRVEENVREWITESSINLLSGDEHARQNILKMVEINDGQELLCDKLDKLELQEEMKDHMEREDLKPQPDFTVLVEDSKKMELKVRAFYKGSTVIGNSDKQDNSEEQANSNTFLPLIEVVAPAIRRRIFQSKLKNILPDLWQALAGVGRGLPASYYIYDKEITLAFNALNSTFALSAKNIVFRNAEWNLVGLVIIKMLSFMNRHVKTLLASKNAIRCTAMILMSYKLDELYLDRFVLSLINDYLQLKQ